MTNKKEETEVPATVKSKPKTRIKKEPKRLLIELVNESNLKKSLIVYRLTEAGLYKQYEFEKRNYQILDLQPSITKSEFKKILGE